MSARKSFSSSHLPQFTFAIPLPNLSAFLAYQACSRNATLNTAADRAISPAGLRGCAKAPVWDGAGTHFLISRSSVLKDDRRDRTVSTVEGSRWVAGRAGERSPHGGKSSTPAPDGFHRQAAWTSLPYSLQGTSRIILGLMQAMLHASPGLCGPTDLYRLALLFKVPSRVLRKM